jgi:hypothetical protein
MSKEGQDMHLPSAGDFGLTGTQPEFSVILSRDVTQRPKLALTKKVLRG